MAKRVYLSTLLKRMGACDESVAWAQSRRGMPGGLRATWNACPNWVWLCWLMQRVGLRNEGLAAWREAVARDYDRVADVYRETVPFDRLLAALERAARR